MGNRLLLALSALAVLAVLALSSASTASATQCTAPYCPSFKVTVKKVGSGSGNVASSPAGIDCGPQCSAFFEEKSTVVLSASPAPGSTFIGWAGGACSGSGDCVLVIPEGDTTVTAVFVAKGPPSNKFNLGKVKHPETGVVTIRVKVPAPGVFTATAKRMKTVKAQVKTPGSFTLPLKLSKKGLALLDESKGRQLRIRISFVYTPTEGEPHQRFKKLIFRVVK